MSEQVKDVAEHNNFTLLRLLLALMVVLGHFKLLQGVREPAFPFDLADAGVDCFFVVSGFLIAGAWERSHGLRAFYVRRVFRLYPMYACVVVLQTGIMLALLPGGVLSEVASTGRYLLVNLVFANFLQTDIGGVLAGAGAGAGLDNHSINPSLWTLKIEIMFYLIVPVIFIGIRRWGWWFLSGVFVLSAIWNGVLSAELGRQLPGQLQFFVVGMGLYLHGEWIRGRVSPLVSLLLVVGFLEAWALGRIPTGVRALAVGAAVYAFALGLRPAAAGLRLDMSYSVYLLHGPLIQVLLLAGLLRDDGVWCGGVVAGVLVLAWMGERAVERPGNALGYRLARRVTTGRQALAENTTAR